MSLPWTRAGDAYGVEEHVRIIPQAAWSSNHHHCGLNAGCVRLETSVVHNSALLCKYFKQLMIVIPTSSARVALLVPPFRTYRDLLTIRNTSNSSFDATSGSCITKGLLQTAPNAMLSHMRSYNYLANQGGVLLRRTSTVSMYSERGSFLHLLQLLRRGCRHIISARRY